MIRQYELVERVRAYDPGADEALLDRAYVFAMKAHGKQKRYSGDPYFSHPLEVAGILTDLKLDSATIATALLHDTIEDTAATFEKLEELFGSEVAVLVDGVTKLTKIELTSEHTKQAENFRKFLLSMSRDVRVLLVKLADRLHNMRTLHYVPNDEKRLRIAQETMDVYAPLAGRMGMHHMREELEDLAFQELNPAARDSLVKRLEFLRARSGNVVGRITSLIQDVLSEAGVEAKVTGREKKPYSIWRKMEQKSISFEQLSDIIGFRIIVPSLSECYRALGALHTRWPTVPGRFKDYISIPKHNDYRSIHTTVIGPEKQRVELQIRTPDMEEVAERGIAAHWRYKDAEDGRDPVRRVQDGGAYRWLRDVVDMLERRDSPEEFLENTKLEMFYDQVFCFTPKGYLIALPRGATPVDFAYAVHTDIGHTAVGAKVNGNPANLRTELQNGDMVEILRTKTAQPQPAWESFVKTGKARSAIRHFVRQRARDEYVSLGKELLEKTFAKERRELSEKSLEPVLRRFEADRPAEVFEAVGRGELAAETVVGALFPEIGHGEGEEGGAPAPKRAVRLRRKEAIALGSLTPGLAIHLAPCCHPLPGDRIVGILERGRGLIVHAIDCEMLERFQESQERWVDVVWDEGGRNVETPVGRIAATLDNEPGALGALCLVIAERKGNISNLRFTERTQLYFRLVVDVEVEDLKHLTQILTALRATPRVRSVERLRGQGDSFADEIPSVPTQASVTPEIAAKQVSAE